MSLVLSDDVQYLKGVGPHRAALLAESVFSSVKRKLSLVPRVAA